MNTIDYYNNNIISDFQPYRGFFFFPYTFQNIELLLIILVLFIQLSLGTTI